MKKVLVIAYFFPPLGGSGVQRVLKFVKYLPAYGIEPIVSTVKKGHNFAYDESLLEEVPSSVKIYRSSSLETLWLRAILEKIAGRGKGKATVAKAGQAEPGNTAKAEVKEGPARNLKEKVFTLINDYLFVPDSKVRWLPLGFRSSLQIARQEKVDYIFSSSYPYTVHLIALLVHKFTKKPWIADFRDPWVGNRAMQKNIAYRRKLDAWLERKVVKNAAYVINVTPGITETYQERYPEYAKKMLTITNGFDPEDFKGLEPVQQDKFTLIHTGIVAETYDFPTLAEGVKRFLAAVPEAGTGFQCLFIGYVPTRFIKLIQDAGLGHIFKFLPYMSHKECLNYLAGAQLQFMTFDQGVKIAYSGKLFDYIGIGKPILGLLPDGIAADLIASRGIGTVVSLNDADGLAQAFEKHFREWTQGQEQKTDSANKCREFSRVELAGQLAGLIK